MRLACSLSVFSKWFLKETINKTFEKFGIWNSRVKNRVAGYDVTKPS